VITAFWLSFHFCHLQRTDLEAKRHEVITRLKQLETEVKEEMATGCHGEMHEPQESGNTR